jgi:hypothetical protein
VRGQEKETLKLILEWLSTNCTGSLIPREVKPCPEAVFLDEIPTKEFSSLLFTVTSTPSALRLIFLQTHATSYNFFSSILTLKRRKEENLIEKQTPMV